MTKRRSYPEAEFVPLKELARRLAIGEDRARKLVLKRQLPQPCDLDDGLPRWHWPTVAAFILEKGNPAAPRSEAGQDDITAAIATRLKKAAANVA